MERINLYFRKPPIGYKWIPGDRYIFNFIRELFKGKKVSGVEKVFLNLCKGFDMLQVDYVKNPSFKKIKSKEPVVVLGSGRYALQGYNKPNPIIAGIGLMTHPYEWVTLFSDYPVVEYLQHSQWTKNIYANYYGMDKCKTWPAGIDTDHWLPNQKAIKKIDFLIYNKIMWEKDATDKNLRQPILKKLDQEGFTYQEIIYGSYTEAEYFNLLQQSYAMIFMCEHESQGFACCEALSMNVPVFAWNQGYWLDPNRFIWNDPVVEASSTPFFDERCGIAFKDFNDFETRLGEFWKAIKAGNFNPRDYILENLTLKKSAQHMLEIVAGVYK